MIFLAKNIAITLILLGLIEFTASLFVNESRFNQIYGVLRSNSDFLWRVRENLDQDFFGAHLQTEDRGFRSANENLEDCKKRVGVFGASPSFGWGVSEEGIYTSRLNEKFKDKGVCFFNFSVIGFSSSQGQKLFKTIIEEEKLDVVLVSYLVNDVDFNRFYFPGQSTDLEVMAELSSYSPIFFIQKLRDTNSFKLLRQLVADENNQDLIEKSIVKTATYKRVKQLEFLENIETMIKLSQEKGIDFYYLEMPVGIHVMSQYLKDHCSIEAASEEKIELVAKKIEGCRITEYNELFDKDSSRSLDQARSIIAMNRFKQYRLSLREKIDREKIVSVRELKLGELEDTFLSENKDYVHPSSFGHQVIAEDIFSVLMNRL